MPSPLYPTGTARARFFGAAERSGDENLARALRQTAKLHDLSDEDLFIAEELLAMSPFLATRERRALGFAVVASLAAIRQGSTRLPLGGGASGFLGQLLRPLVAASGVQVAIGTLVKDISLLAQGNTFGRLFGGTNEDRPFVYDDACIYQHRHYRLEEDLVTRILERMAAPRIEVDPAIVQAVAHSGYPLSQAQLDAVRAAIAGPLAVISGGPGTGKTAITVAIIRAAVRMGLPVESIRLAAPTGKAAQRMADSIHNGLVDASEAPDLEIKNKLAPPLTVHRLLGFEPRTGRFRHHRNYPISGDLLIVDEASMLDLGLAEGLFAATHDGARIVLLGDGDQLPSVDAGAVLRDLVIAGEAMHGDNLGVRLSESYRMRADDPNARAILEFAGFVNDGDAKSALAHLKQTPAHELGRPGAQQIRNKDGAGLEPALHHWFEQYAVPDETLFRTPCRSVEGRLASEDITRIDALFEFHQQAQLLTITRKLATGAEAINLRLSTQFRQAHWPNYDQGFVPGQPVLLRQNDYRRNLWNGDLGVIALVAADGEAPAPRALFADSDGWRVFSLQAVRGKLDLAYAMTVHQSQGSEWEQVFVLMPENDVPLSSREMLYTAVTRARSGATLIGESPIIRKAIHRRVNRHSGIANKLVGPRMGA